MYLMPPRRMYLMCPQHIFLTRLSVPSFVVRTRNFPAQVVFAAERVARAIVSATSERSARIADTAEGALVRIAASTLRAYLGDSDDVQGIGHAAALSCPIVDVFDVTQRCVGGLVVPHLVSPPALLAATLARPTTSSAMASGVEAIVDLLCVVVSAKVDFGVQQLLLPLLRGRAAEGAPPQTLRALRRGRFGQPPRREALSFGCLAAVNALRRLTAVGARTKALLVPYSGVLGESLSHTIVQVITPPCFAHHRALAFVIVADSLCVAVHG